MKITKKIFWLSFIFAAFLFVILIDIIPSFADHILLRTDTIAYRHIGGGLCLDSGLGDVTANYFATRYITIPDRSSDSFRITSSDYPRPPFCDTETEISLDPSAPSSVQAGDTIKLYTTDPNASHDTTPPVQSNITAGSITQTSATITWTTNESATHTIKYGTTSGSYDSYPNTKAAGTGTSASGAP